MSQKLRELIRTVRACKTAAEERAVITKECAMIRTAFKEDDNSYRHRNVAKLLFIHMLGYPTAFGQMECLKLIASGKFPEKRIGYLGLTQLLDENTEVLMLITNSIKNDLNCQGNQYIQGLALGALGDIGSSEMCRDLAPEILRIIKSSTNAYVRKKACLTAMRIIRKVPDLQEEFIEQIPALFEDRNHAVILTGLTLLIEQIENAPSLAEQFRRYVPGLVRTLKNLLLSGYAPEYDVSGITDPFLQCRILHLFRLLGRGDAHASEEMNDVLAQVATNTEGAKNAGNAILYECVQTIMAIESESGLRVLAINILGKFLLNRDNNIRYVALKTLQHVVSADEQTVQRHRATVVDCLRDPDISIRRRALDLTYALVNESNVKSLVKELLNYLLVADVEFKEDLTTKVFMVVDKYSPNRRWQVDTIIKVMSLAGNYVRDEVAASLIQVISSTPELHSYAVHKIFFSLKDNMSQESLVQTGIWCIGEFGDLLVSGQAVGPDNVPIRVSEDEVLDLVEAVIKRPSCPENTKEMCVTAVAKLCTRFSPSGASRASRIVNTFASSIHTELQQRACEYLQLLSPQWSESRAEIFERMPAAEKRAHVDGFNKDTPVGDLLVDDAPESSPSAAAPAKPKSALSDLDDLLSLGSTPAPTTSAPASKSVSVADSLLDIFSAPATSGPSVPVSAPVNPMSNLLDILGSSPAPVPNAYPTGLMAPAPVAPMAPSSGLDLLGGFGAPAAPAAASQFPPSVAFDSRGVKIVFEFSKQPGQPDTTIVNAKFVNSTPATLSEFIFQAAVPKYLKLTMNPATSSVVPGNSNGQVTQKIIVQNSMQGEKPLLMKIKVDYNVNGQPVSEQGQVSNFPAGL